MRSGERRRPMIYRTSERAVPSRAGSTTTTRGRHSNPRCRTRTLRRSPRPPHDRAPSADRPASAESSRSSRSSRSFPSSPLFPSFPSFPSFPPSLRTLDPGRRDRGRTHRPTRPRPRRGCRRGPDTGRSRPPPRLRRCRLATCTRRTRWARRRCRCRSRRRTLRTRRRAAAPRPCRRSRGRRCRPSRRSRRRSRRSRCRGSTTRSRRSRCRRRPRSVRWPLGRRRCCRRRSRRGVLKPSKSASGQALPPPKAPMSEYRLPAPIRGLPLGGRSSRGAQGEGGGGIRGVGAQVAAEIDGEAVGAVLDLRVLAEVVPVGGGGARRQVGVLVRDREAAGVIGDVAVDDRDPAAVDVGGLAEDGRARRRDARVDQGHGGGGVLDVHGAPRGARDVADEHAVLHHDDPRLHPQRAAVVAPVAAEHHPRVGGRAVLVVDGAAAVGARHVVVTEPRILDDHRRSPRCTARRRRDRRRRCCRRRWSCGW